MENKKGYVDNKRLYDEFVNWHTARQTNPEAQMSNYIAQAILDISKGLCHRFNFNRYTWKEEMVGDAIINCVKYAKNFDHVTYSNPHAYISRICEQTFVQRIKKEKREIAARYKHFTKEVFDMDLVDNGNVDYNFYLDINSKVHEYEKNLKTKRKPKDLDVCVYEIPEELLHIPDDESFIENAMRDYAE